MKNTCGFFIFNKNTKKVLFGHVTNNNEWSIPKGKQEEGETLFQAALRELEEEANITKDFISKCYVYKLDPINYNHKKKRLNSFLAICEETPTDISCPSTFVDSYGNKLPELDMHRWFEIPEVVNKLFPIHYTQHQAFLQAYEILKNENII